MIGANRMSVMSRANLDLMVLSVLAEGPCYGYLIQQRVSRASGGAIKLQAGTLYPLLHRLEADKLVRGKWDGSTARRRKWYSLTASGRRQLARQARRWQKYAQCLESLLAPVLRGELN